MNNIFVFDTNTLVSAYLLPNSISRQAYDKALDIGILVRSETTLAEFKRIFSLPKFDKYLTTEKRREAILEYESVSFLSEITFNEKVSRDSNDDKFINLALSTQASTIITGDPDLLSVNGFKGIEILNSSDFVKKFK
jgi:hypothetical protein